MHALNSMLTNYPLSFPQIQVSLRRDLWIPSEQQRDSHEKEAGWEYLFATSLVEPKEQKGLKKKIKIVLPFFGILIQMYGY